MAGVDTCTFCGVPRFISKALRWEDNGVISLPASPGERMVFYDAVAIDHLFDGIHELIGTDISNMVIESRRRETRRYMERLVPEDVVRVLNDEDTDTAERKAKGRQYNLQIDMVGMLYGYGHIAMSGLWDTEDPHPWREQIYHDPYSLRFCMADTLGTVEAIERRDLWVESMPAGENAFLVRVIEGEHPLEFSGRLRRKRYPFKPGDISFKRCMACGIPLEVARCHWNVDKGTIYDPQTGRRMVFIGSAAMDAVLDDLQSELGESIPEVVIEAQRQFVKRYVGSVIWPSSAEENRMNTALRGLGNITEFRATPSTLGLTIQNSCLHLPMVGLTAALAELARGAEKSGVEWELQEDGDLRIELRF